MTKQTAQQPAVVQQSPATPAQEAAQPMELTLDEWCTRKSKVDRRPEMIGAFYADTIGAVPKSTEAGYEALYQTFGNRPA